MLSLTSAQTDLLEGNPELTWLFTVVDTSSNTYRWSTKAYTWDGNTFSFMVRPDSFSGISMSRNKAEHGIIAPNKTSFEVINEDNTLAASDFDEGTCLIELIAKDESDEQKITGWKFVIKRSEDFYQKIKFNCVDFVSDKLKGEYPNTKLVSEVFPSTEADESNICVPVVFGTAYIPLQSFWYSGDSTRYYLLGDSSYTYTVSAVHSPQRWDVDAEWTTADGYSLNVLTKDTDWKVLQPVIADSDNDGAADAVGIWKQSGRFLPIVAQFTRSDTSSTTGPEDVLEFLLEDFGVDSDDIDTGAGSTFETAGTTYSGWSLTFNGGFWHKEPRAKILSRVLAQCSSYLVITDKVELHVKDADSVNSGDQLSKADLKKGSTTASPSSLY